MEGDDEELAEDLNHSGSMATKMVLAIYH